MFVTSGSNLGMSEGSLGSFGGTHDHEMMNKDIDEALKKSKLGFRGSNARDERVRDPVSSH